MPPLLHESPRVPNEVLQSPRLIQTTLDSPFVEISSRKSPGRHLASGLRKTVLREAVSCLENQGLAMAVLPEFGLHVYQQPAGTDFRALAEHKPGQIDYIIG